MNKIISNGIKQLQFIWFRCIFSASISLQISGKNVKIDSHKRTMRDSVEFPETQGVITNNGGVHAGSISHRINATEM